MPLVLLQKVFLEPGARLLLREELLLGRHAEQSGSVRQRLRVTLGDRALHDQELHIDPRDQDYLVPVTGGRRAIGSLLLVDSESSRPSAAVGNRVVDTDTAVLPLAGQGVLVTALADDAVSLRRRLDAGLRALCG